MSSLDPATWGDWLRAWVGIALLMIWAVGWLVWHHRRRRWRYGGYLQGAVSDEERGNLWIEHVRVMDSDQAYRYWGDWVPVEDTNLWLYDWEREGWA